MFFRKSKEIKRLKEENNNKEYHLNNMRYKLERLEKENKKLIEDFVKNYHYVLTVDKNRLDIHLYQDGQEIKHIKDIDFNAAMDSIPTFNIEVN